MEMWIIDNHFFGAFKVYTLGLINTGKKFRIWKVYKGRVKKLIMTIMFNHKNNMWNLV